MNTTMEKETTMKWYIVRAQSNRERSVSEKLRKEGEKGDLMGAIGRVLVPTEKSFHLKDGKKVTREKVMYPGYIFVETRSIGELAHFVSPFNSFTGEVENIDGDKVKIAVLIFGRKTLVELNIQQIDKHIA